MASVEPRTALDRGIEAVLQQDRRVVAASLAVVIVLAWLYLWVDAQSMARMAMPGMPMDAMSPTSSPAALALTLAMWVVMMIGMMLPSAAPMLLLHGALARKKGVRGNILPAVWTFASGYLLVWTGFSVAAVLLQALLHRTGMLTPMIASGSAYLSAALLAAAGVYQWTPLKAACLKHCRSPVEFLATRWRAGRAGALRMGIEHGAYCVGCCWVLMLLLFVAGVMNLLWVALLAGFVLLEKVAPRPALTGRLAGAALMLAAVAVLRIS